MASVGGMLAGQAANAAEQRETPYMYLALSPTRIYLFAREGAGVGELLARFNRDEVGVEIHSRPLRRIVVIEELRSGHRLALEAPRGPMYRDKTVLAMLHQDAGG